jgi:hypothetical protein
MKRLTLVMALLALAGLLSISASPAAAEFKATNKSTEGEAYFQIEVEGVGNTLNCGSLETTQLAWQIKKSGKASGSGSELGLKFKSWGTCVVKYEDEESAKLKEATLSGGECLWEATESGSEREVAAKIASGCVLKGEIGKKTCEVTLPTKANEKLSALTLIDSGKENENLSVTIGLAKANVSVSGAGCETAGIKSSSTAKLAGVIEASGVKAEVVAPVFRVYRTGSGSMTAVGQTKMGGVVNSGDPGAPGNILQEGDNVLFFRVFAEPFTDCQNGVLLENVSCPMTVEFSQMSGDIKRFLLETRENGVTVSRVTFTARSI